MTALGLLVFAYLVVFAVVSSVLDVRRERRNR